MTKPAMFQIHVDKPMTEASIQYRNQSDYFIGQRMFGNVPVAEKSGYYYVYDKGPFFRDQAILRAPGSHFPETGFGLTTATYNTFQYAIAGVVPDELRAAADDPLDLDIDTTNMITQAGLIRFELAAQTLAMTAANWTSSDPSATDWDASGGLPLTAVQRAQRTVQGLTGMVPNAMAVGLIVHHGLLTNAQLTGLVSNVREIKPNDMEVLLTGAMGLEEYFVSKASYDSTNEDVTDAGTIAAIFDDDALVYVKAARPTIRSAMAATLLHWGPGGGMGVIERIRLDERKADQLRFYAQFDYELVSADCGYIFKDVV